MLGPHQLGVGVPGGLEAIVHAVDKIVEEGDKDLLILQVDLINAFNLCDRDSTFRVVEEVFPDILKWVLTCYDTNAVLIFGNTIIMSECGFNQGDPLASAFLPDTPSHHRQDCSGCPWPETQCVVPG